MTELRGCVKVEVALPYGPYGLWGPKVTLNLNGVQSEPRGSVNRKVELGSHRVSWPVFCFRLFSGYCLCDFVPHSRWKWLVAKYISCFVLASSTPPYGLCGRKATLEEVWLTLALSLPFKREQGAQQGPWNQCVTSQKINLFIVFF